MFLRSHVFYCWPCGLQHLCRSYGLQNLCWSCGLQNLCIIASMDPGTSPKHDGEHANYYIYCPTYTHIPEISFSKPPNTIFHGISSQEFPAGKSARRRRESGYCGIFLGIYARPGFHSNERPFIHLVFLIRLCGHFVLFSSKYSFATSYALLPLTFTS